MTSSTSSRIAAHLSVAHGGTATIEGWDDVLARYAHHVAAAPEAPAVEDGELTWTYAELDALAGRTADALRDRVRPGDLVAVCLDRSAALVATAVAVARLGAVYLPLGPRPGERRLAAVADGLRVACLIGAPGVLPEAYAGAELLSLPLPAEGANAQGRAVAAFPAAAPDSGRPAVPDGTFYAVLTSGSTGVPKAVAVPGTALAARLRWYAARTAARPGDRHSLLVGVSFDPHVLELWTALTSGAALAVPPDDVRWDPEVLTAWWRRAGVTVAILPTPLAEIVLERPWPDLPALRHLSIGGDRLRRRPGPDVTARVDNAYGPAEAAVVATAYALEADGGAHGGLPPIGTPADGTVVCVTGPDGHVVPRGEAGELRIGGAGLATGYLDEALTARRFVAPPPELTGTGRVYRTGDRVQMRPDGVLEFLGRLDDQVKVRGARIEPAETETAFEDDPRVLRAVVAAESAAGGDVRLIAFVRLAPDAGALPAAELLEAVRGRLPEQAVPSALRYVETFPLDANGKVDRAALLAGDAPVAGVDGTGTDTERLVVELCRGLLGRPETGPGDNFLASGGDSLTAARLLTALEERFGVRLRAPQLLRQPDLHSLAALVDSRREQAPAASTTPEAGVAFAATADRSGSEGPGTRPADTAEPSERAISAAATAYRGGESPGLHPVELHQDYSSTVTAEPSGAGVASAAAADRSGKSPRTRPAEHHQDRNPASPAGPSESAVASAATAEDRGGESPAGHPVAWVDTHTALGRARPGGVLGRVLDRASADPSALAVTDGELTLTYGELAAAARRLAGALQARGVGRGTPVGLLLPHSVGAVVAKTAVWWAGGHYVPLDAAYPRARTEAMLADAGVSLVVGEKDLLEAAGIPAVRTLVLTAGGLAGCGLDAADGDLPEPPPYEPGATAYVMYTSGSTGRPKGVAITHRGIAGLTAGPDFLTVTPRDRVLFHSALTFDGSPFELWVALANGAAVAVSTAGRQSLESLARDVERLGATVAFLTTALFHHLAARRSPVFSVLRSVIVGGEALSARHARAVLRAHPWLELVNGYGPTETTSFATAHRVRDADCDAPPPVGRPLAGATAHVLDEHGAAVPAGTRGELWVGGPRLAAGYLGQEALTAERFVDHPSAGRLYRTGDVVSARPDGTLDFHGRVDDQVKVRGFRIEPGEIEHALRDHPRVADAAVTVVRAGEDDARLVAFVVPDGDGQPAVAALRDHLAGRLPAHLLPNAWSVVDALPLTGNGKVDRRALAGRPVPGLPQSPDAAGPVRRELTPLQRAVADAWGRALECEVGDPDADFLALGGHSLLALGVVDDLREDLGVELTLAAFFAAPTVAGQAALVEEALAEAFGTEPDAERNGAGQ
ncbi:amino acid adenylation domain-containing protein [Streptomyces roseoverticillatus]|uniref:amino acid adenylation domain-containing protein n=1 Tax=Streptomyces roseoverticillatus TaxID=66429 RepID=UPI001F1E17A9|nr:amino acid adenylation domain-containing protein [Streptomyces roseoverticillatus]